MTIRTLRVLTVGLSAIGLLLSPGLAGAAQPGSSPTADQILTISDVELDGQGGLRGLVVNPEGMPVAKAEVLVRQQDKDLASTRSDGAGQFRIGPLRGGIHQVSVGQHQRLVRVWTAKTAPPAANDYALIVVGGDVVRGQMAGCEAPGTKTLLMLGVVGAMVAVPVAIHNSHRSDGPVSP